MTNRSDFIDLRRIYTKTGRRQIRQAELESIRRAQNHVFLENPYLYDNASQTTATYESHHHEPRQTSDT